MIATLGGNAASLAAKAVTTTQFQSCFHGSVDPVEAGLVASLKRPGGNVTGVVTLNIDTGQKRLELTQSADRRGLLLNPTLSGCSCGLRKMGAALLHFTFLNHPAPA